MISITFSSVVIGTLIAALILTTILKFTTDRIEKFLLSVLQNFCGILFIFSGMVKAVDPLGTAYKMEQYFAEFQGTFEGAGMDWIAAIFPTLAGYSAGFSVFMIVLEIVVGIMFVIGARVRLASWIFLLLIVFFTILTGFTFLTGYVPSDANFFSFSEWGPYAKTNMKVTDCGCFGDFLKIEPKVSFFKDVVLLVPGLIFIFTTKKMHKLFSSKVRDYIVGISTVLLLWYCLSNFVWDIPHTDFRPFREGVDIREQRRAELDAANNVQVVAFKLKNKETGKVVELSSKVYMAEFANYPKDTWETIEQVKTEPEVAPTKLSDFYITDNDGYDISDTILAKTDYNFWVVSYKVGYDISYENVTVIDTVEVADSVFNETTGEFDSLNVVQHVVENKTEKPIYSFDPALVEDYKTSVVPLLKELGLDGIIFVGGMDSDARSAFAEALDVDTQIVEADDILLKTIIRSNPGVVLMKDGVVIKKWHKDNLPDVKGMKKFISE